MKAFLHAAQLVPYGICGPLTPAVLTLCVANRRSHLGLVIAAAITTAFLLLSCWRGYSISEEYHKCVPPDYPSLRTAAMIAREAAASSTADSVERVRDVYVSLFKPDNPLGPYTPGTLWTIEPIAKGYLFECSSSPNRYEIETGCVLLTPASTGTTVTRMWDISEGGLNCRTILHIPNE